MPKKSERGTVVITGASSGIGWSSVSRMVKDEWRVVATVRKQQDADKLKSSFGANVLPVEMDIEDRKSIDDAASQISTLLGEAGLDGLVNVAGIGMVRPIEYAKAEEIQQIFNINVFGQIAVTQAMLPLLRKVRGRIVNISSVGAHISIPFASLINASKSAFGTFSDTLRLELRPFGMHVSVIEPGAIKTPAVEKTLGNTDAIIQQLPANGIRQYGEMLRTFSFRAYEREMNGSSPGVVADAVHDALTARKPRIRYVVGKHAKILVTLPRILPDVARDAVVLRITGLPTKFGEIKTGEEVETHKQAA